MMLPGTPCSIKLRCPACGWGFDLGLRKLGQTDLDDPDEHHFTCCSKCLAMITFDVKDDVAVGVMVLTADALARMSPESQMMAHKMHFIAWIAQRVPPRTLQ